jgi:hypothetical protein
MQLVFSTLADMDLGAGNSGTSNPTSSAQPSFGTGTRAVQYPNVANPATPNTTAYPTNPGHSAIITMYEACWMTSWSVSGYSKDSGQIMETAEVMVSDVHDFASQYGEFLPTGNDPTAGQLGSIRYGSATSAAAASPGVFVYPMPTVR